MLIFQLKFLNNKIISIDFVVPRMRLINKVLLICYSKVKLQKFYDFITKGGNLRQVFYRKHKQHPRGPALHCLPYRSTGDKQICPLSVFCHTLLLSHYVLSHMI
ncbi:hypothetical protein PAEPH01_0897 [Pancytospora epiphaga]|nr:hypothetical protein PAEPH01_0897 [Pancytospora epiphaga]